MRHRPYAVALLLASLSAPAVAADGEAVRATQAEAVAPATGNEHARPGAVPGAEPVPARHAPRGGDTQPAPAPEAPSSADWRALVPGSIQ